jgi:hypothetical protein
MTTVASNPGRTSLNPLAWFLSYPVWILFWIIGLAGFTFLAWRFHKGFAAGSAVFVLGNLFYWMRVRAHFMHGCVCPGVVVSTNPLLIAVATDLSCAPPASHPAIKVIEASLGRISGKVPEVGVRCATVALYDPPDQQVQGSWSDFDPRPIETATWSSSGRAQVLASIAVKDWNELDGWLKRVPKPYRPGLFRIAPFPTQP